MALSTAYVGGIYALTKVQPDLASSPLLPYLYGVPLMWIPGALALRDAEKPSLELPPRGTRFKWVALCIGTPLASVFMSGVLSVAGNRDVTLDLSGHGFVERLAELGAGEEVVQQVSRAFAASSVPPAIGSVPQVIIGACLANVWFALGEELAWRGRLRDWKWSGIVWGLWHSPIIVLFGHNYATHRVAGAFMFTAWCAAAHIGWRHVARRSKSVWTAALLHGMTNACGTLPLLMISKGGNELTVGTTGWPGVVAAALTSALLVRFV